MNTDIIPLKDPKATELFQPGGLDSLLAQIETHATSIVADAGTAKGRDAIRSNAANVARAKVYLDSLGKEYVAKLKAMPRQVDAERKTMRDRLDALRDEVRRPLTDWEREEARKEAETIAMVADFESPVLMGATSVEIAARLRSMAEVTLPLGINDEQAGRILRAQRVAREKLTRALEHASRAEYQAAELERLQRENAEREQREREERAALELEERIKREKAEAAEKAKLQAEQAAERERQRLEQERAEADARVRAQELRREAEARESERQRVAAEQRAQEAEERAKCAAAEAERRERDRAESERQRVEEEKRRREADKAHRRNIESEVIADLIALEPTSPDNLVSAIAAGKIRHVRIVY